MASFEPTAPRRSRATCSSWSSWLTTSRCATRVPGRAGCGSATASRESTTLGRYLSLPLVPTFAGFDPRLQLLHEEDAAEAIARAALGHQEGVFNVAGDGVVLLSQAIAIMGGAAASDPAAVRPLDRRAWRSASATGVQLPAHLARAADAFGSVIDCSRLAAGVRRGSPRYSSRAVDGRASRSGKTEEPIEAPSPPQEYELQVYLQRRRRERA